MNTFSNEELSKKVKMGLNSLQFSAKRIDRDLLSALEEVALVAREKELNMLAQSVVKGDITIK